MNNNNTPAGAGEQTPREVNFASTAWNEFGYENLLEHLAELTPYGISNYPEPDNITLRTMLAKRNNLKPQNFVVVNGRTAAFYRIAQAWAGARAALLVPYYPQYKAATDRYGWKHKLLSNDLSTEEIDLSECDFCWLSSPNNPDGKVRSRAELLRLIDAHPRVKFVLDQSYSTFTTVPGITMADIKTHPNIIVVRSFTHAYGLPGLRIGYIVADVPVAQQISRFLEPWSVNTLSVEAVKFILIHPAQFTLPIRKWQRSAKELIDKLRTIDGLTVFPGDVPFFLVRLERVKGAALVKHLREQYGFRIHDASGFEGLDDRYVRITARSEEQNNALVQAIQESLSLPEFAK